MVKKSIIAIVLMGMLATVSYGQDAPYPGAPAGQIKIDGFWPGTISFTYTPLEICRIPIYIKVGMFIEIENCNSKRITLEQVNCPPGQQFPCYKGCVTIKVRANFEAQLSLKLYKFGGPNSIIASQGPNNKWKAYFRENAADTVQHDTWDITGDGNWNYVDICVEAWDANIYATSPNSNPQVGEVAVLAVPTVIPDCHSWCNYVQ